MTAASQFSRHRFSLGRIAAFATIFMAAVPAQSQSPVQPQAAIVNGTHFMEFKHQLCDNKATCLLRFAVVAIQKELLVTRVTCRIVIVDTPSGIISIILSRRQSVANPANIGPQSHIIPVRLSTNDDIGFYSANSETSYLYPAGQIPQVTVTTFTGGKINFADCTLFGTLQNALVP